MRLEHWLYTIPLRLRSLFRRAQADQQLDDELRDHLERKTEEYVAEGMAREEARRRARLDLSGIEQTKEKCREARRANWIHDFVQDLRFGSRLLRKSPVFTAVAVVTLALGIGANAAVFSLVDTILLRPLPYQRPEELVVVSQTVPPMSGEMEVGMAAGEYLDYHSRSGSFVQTAAYETAGFNLTGEGTPLRVNAAAVTGSLFPLLGVRPRLGRVFTADEEHLGSTPVVVLSYPLWQNHYDADPAIVGKRIKLDEKPYLVVGVMSPWFQFPFDGAPLSERADLWVPEIFTPDRLQDRLREFGVGFIGRLKPGVKVEQAQADVATVAAGFMRQYPEFYSGTLRVAPRADYYAAHSVRKARSLVLMLLAAVGCVLLIACANVANLLLARGRYRGHEMAIRSAIGAGRRRLLLQCLVESVLLSALGAGAGIGLAVWLVDGVRKFGPADVPHLQEAGLNPSALWFTVALSLATTLLFGLLPAWRLSHVAPLDCLRESPQAGSARTTQRLQSLVAVAEIAIALVLLAASSLLLRSFVRVLNAPLGLRPENALVIRTLFDRARYPDPIRREVAQRELIDGVAHLNGVQVVAAASHLPLSDSRQIGFRLEHAAPDDFHWAENSLVSPGYFRAMGIPILRGREFTGQDRRDTPLAAVINETLARQYFPAQDPIGQRFHWGDRDLFTIVGVTGDVRITALDRDPPPMIYLSMFQVESGASERTALILRLESRQTSYAGLFSQVRQEVWSLDRNLPLYDFTSLEMLISESVAQRRFTTLLMASFALVALALALVGLFGVMSFLVAQRQRELAIRMALGSDQVGVRRLVLKRAAALALLGCALGLALFPLAGQVIRATLYQTSTYDPPTLLAVPALLVGVALLATYIPARRATKVDPMVALRCQ